MCVAETALERRQKQEEIDFPDRRKNMTPQQCLSHDDNMKRLSQAEAGVSICLERTANHQTAVGDLYEKYNAINTQILQRLTAIEGNQQNVLDDVAGIKDDICEIKTKHDNYIERLMEIEKFKWFRDTANRIHDRLPWYILFIGILLIFFILGTIDVSIGKILKFFRFGV